LDAVGCCWIELNTVLSTNSTNDPHHHHTMSWPQNKKTKSPIIPLTIQTQFLL
jgi:hypothetical protein